MKKEKKKKLDLALRKEKQVKVSRKIKKINRAKDKDVTTMMMILNIVISFIEVFSDSFN